MAPLNPAYLHVYLTGFGPFGDYETNPSWEAVAPLEGSILTSKPAWPVPGLDGAREVSSGESHGDTGTATRTGTAIKLSTSRIPVTYSAATRLVKAIHAGHGGSAQEDVGSITDYTTSSARSSDPPDIVIHVGVGLPHGLKLETRARRWGYDKPGSDGRLAPEDPADDDADSELAPRRRRGLVGKEWDAVPDELRTLVPTGRVVERLRAEAIKIDESDDAGTSTGPGSALYPQFPQVSKCH